MKKTSDIDVELGALIRARRLELESSMEELAAKIGVTYQQVQKYEADKNRISVKRLFDIATALNVHPAFFLLSPYPDLRQVLR